MRGVGEGVTHSIRVKLVLGVLFVLLRLTNVAAVVVIATWLIKRVPGLTTDHHCLLATGDLTRIKDDCWNLNINDFTFFESLQYTDVTSDNLLVKF